MCQLHRKQASVLENAMCPTQEANIIYIMMFFKVIFAERQFFPTIASTITCSWAAAPSLAPSGLVLREGPMAAFSQLGSISSSHSDTCRVVAHTMQSQQMAAKFPQHHPAPCADPCQQVSSRVPESQRRGFHSCCASSPAHSVQSTNEQRIARKASGGC